MSHPERFTFVSAVHVFLDRGNDVLLLRRFNTGYEDGNYSVIAGHLDGNERVVDAAIREAREEAGIDLDRDSTTVVGVMYRLSNDERIDFFVAASHWWGRIENREPHKCDDLAWFDIENLPPNVIPYIRAALENYRDRRWFSSFGWDRT